MARASLLAAASFTVILWAGAAQAQDAQTVRTNEDAAAAQPAPGAQETGENDTAVEEVVVTAERRSTSLQTTAVSATVLNGTELTNRGVTSVDQLQFVAPSTTVQNFGQGNFFNIRGIGKGESTTAVGVGVITYRDGVAAFPGYFQTEPYYDLAGVEVLRGPQGTFAGANATGGAVFIRSREPDFNGVSGYFLGQVGNYDDVLAQGAINVPLSETLAARISFNRERRGSFFNLRGTYTGNPGELDSTSVRLSVLWQPTDRFRLIFRTDYNDIDLGGYPADPALSTSDRFSFSINGPNSARDVFTRSSLTATYRFENGLTLRSITGYQNGRSDFSTDLDGTSLLNNTFYDTVREQVWSQEFNLLSPENQRFTWLAGLYFQRDDVNFPVSTFPRGAYRIGFPENVVDIYLFGDTPKTTYAAFGQMTYNFTDRLQIQVGARYAQSESSNENVYTTYPQFGIVLLQNESRDDDAVTGKVTLNYEHDANNFFYAFVATGHKQGGLNAPNLYFQARPFDAEDLVTLEAGWNSIFFNGRVRTQLSGYYTRYQNYQVAIGDPIYPQVSSILNVVGDTTLAGVEASAQGRFGPLAFNAAVSISNSELGDFFAADPRLTRTGACDPSSGPRSVNCNNLAGARLRYAPRLTVSLGAQYSFDLGGGAYLTPRLDYAHISSSFTTIFANEALGDRLKDRNILNGLLTYSRNDWSLGLYGTNLTDQSYTAAINSNLRYAGPPRQYGVRLTRTF